MHTLSYSVPPTLQPALLIHASTGDSWTLVGKSESVSYGVTAPFSWVLVCTRFCLCPPRVCSNCSIMGLMAISSNRIYVIPRSAAPRTPVPVTDHHKSVPPQETIKHSSASVSVGSLGSGVHKVCLSPLSVYGGNGV